MDAQKVDTIAKHASEYFKALGTITKLCNWKIELFYYCLDEAARPMFLENSRRDLVAKILKHIRDVDAATGLAMVRRQRGYIFAKIGEEKRRAILGHMTSFQKKEITLEFHLYQLVIIKDLDGRIPGKYIAEDYLIPGRPDDCFPLHFPESMKKCVRCNEGYLVWDSVITAGCQKHSFHKRCIREELVCVKCK
jgi:hypothetical protein